MILLVVVFIGKSFGLKDVYEEYAPERLRRDGISSIETAKQKLTAREIEKFYSRMPKFVAAGWLSETRLRVFFSRSCPFSKFRIVSSVVF